MKKRNHNRTNASIARRAPPASNSYTHSPLTSYRNAKSRRSVNQKIMISIFCFIIISTMGLYTTSSILTPTSLSNNSNIGRNLAVSDKKVAAFYYGWYSNSTNYSQTTPISVEDDTSWRHWGIGDPNANNDDADSRWTPNQGWFDSADPSIIETHLRQAEWAGLDAFIVSFWGTGKHEYENFKTMLRVANQIGSKLKFTLYIETSRYKNLENSVVIDLFIPELESIYDFFTDQNQNPEKDFIWTQNGKPVLFTYVSQFIEEQVWSNVINYLDGKGKSFFLNADRPGSSPTFNENFQGAHQYDVYYPTYSNQYYNTFNSIKTNCIQFNQVFCAGIGPGYDDTYVRPEANHPPLERFDGDTYRDSWENALTLNPDWITITSWNEWHEGSEIEPSVENGDLALRQTKSYIRIFKANVVITIYDDTNYQGNKITLDVGNYPDIRDVGMVNDVLSSIKIGDGLKVILFEHINYAGSSWILNDDINDLNRIGANDNVSSIKVSYIVNNDVSIGNSDITFALILILTIGAFIITGVIGSIKNASNNRNNNKNKRIKTWKNNSRQN